MERNSRVPFVQKNSLGNSIQIVIAHHRWNFQTKHTRYFTTPHGDRLLPKIAAIYVFLRLWTETSGVEVHKLIKRERSQFIISGHLDPATLGQQRTYSMPFGRIFCRTQRMPSSGQDSAILPARAANRGSSCPLNELAIYLAIIEWGWGRGG